MKTVGYIILYDLQVGVNRVLKQRTEIFTDRKVAEKLKKDILRDMEPTVKNVKLCCVVECENQESEIR